ncbi:hypothetical protein [uncultured Helicobacter sp.]|nr:hypothetical protein [uncultured Helicobacter sp.]
MSTYTNGVQNGENKQYDESGIVRLESHFANGDKIGAERSYDKNGALITERVYNTGIPKEVKVSWFYPNGKLKMQMLYQDNQALWQKAYNEQGEVNAKLDCKAENCLAGLGEISTHSGFAE